MFTSLCRVSKGKQFHSGSPTLLDRGAGAALLVIEMDLF